MTYRFYFTIIVSGRKCYEDFEGACFGQARTDFFKKHNFTVTKIDTVWELEMNKKVYPKED